MEHLQTTNISSQADVRDYGIVRDDVRGYMYISICFASVAFASVIHILKYKLQDTNQFVNIFWMSSLGALLSGVAMPVVETLIFPRSPACVALLFTQSVCAGFANISLVVSLSIVSTLSFSVLSCLQSLFLLAAQYTVLSNVNPGHRNVF